MADALAILEGLPIDLVERLLKLRDTAHQMLAEQEKPVPVIHRSIRLVAGKPQETFSEVMEPKVKNPRLGVTVQTSEDQDNRVTRVTLTLVKPPGERPRVLTLGHETYPVLCERTEQLGVSWESFFEQVVQRG